MLVLHSYSALFMLGTLGIGMEAVWQIAIDRVKWTKLIAELLMLVGGLAFFIKLGHPFAAKVLFVSLPLAVIVVMRSLPALNRRIRKLRRARQNF